MESLRIVILGGCLNSGYGLVGINQLYHRIMARALEREHGCAVRVILGRLDTHEHAGMIDRATKMVTKHKPDILLFQIRPDFLWGLYSALWLKREGCGLSRLRQNPHAKYGNRWPEGLEPTICPMHRFAAINMELAKRMGWHAKAKDHLRQRIDELRELSQYHDVLLGIISPLFGTYYPACFQQYAHKEILPMLLDTDLPLMDLMSCARLRDPTNWADRFHLNAEGHQVAADVAICTIGALLPHLT